MERRQCCRTCLAEADLEPLFASPEHHEKYSQVVLEATGVHVIWNDPLPQLMCAACITSVNESYKFRKKSQMTQRELSAALDHSNCYPLIEQVFLKPDILLHSINISDLLEAETVLDNITEDDVDVFCEDNLDDLNKGNSTQEKIEEEKKCTNESLRVETDSMQKTVNVQKNLRKRKSKAESMDDTLSKEMNTQTVKVVGNHKKKKLKEDVDDKLSTKNNLRDETTQEEVEIKKEEAKPAKRTARPRKTKEKQPDEETVKMKKVKEKAAGERQHIECEQCHKVLTSRLSLRNHYKIHSGFDIVCEHCGKRFITRRLLLMHCKAKHGYEKTDRCRHCPYRACNAEQVKIHERLHTGEKPYACGVGECAASFTRRSSLLQHRASHLPDKTVPCPQCNACFKSTTLMRIHLSRHRAPRVEFSCGVCALRSRRRRNLARHLVRAHALSAPAPHLIHRTQIRD